MKKIASDWIEGTGNIQALIRTLMLWACPTEEHTKGQLVKVIAKKTGTYGPYTLQFAIDRRKRKIQWFFVYLPLLAFSVPGMLLMTGALISQNLRLFYLALAAILSFVFIFRILFSIQYQEFYRMICYAADALWEERLDNAGAEKVIVGPYSEVKPHLGFLPHHQVEKTEPEEVEGDLPNPGKGAIPLFLLNELIKQEAKRPNIFSGEIHETILLHADISGCRLKNILNKTKYYKSRRFITLDTENSRTTHRKYLDKLLHHYNAIGDDVLSKGAEDLLIYLENNSGPKGQ
jgi:hypothetical protein